MVGGGIAEDPTCPARKPSVTSSWPAMSRIVSASEDGSQGLSGLTAQAQASPETPRKSSVWLM